ncbi:MAG: DAK2 domain-containing protein [Acidimicrobiia bacterium]|nr:DAK2 domain-containing protein [Acidimicrobiia bacterium]MDH5292619.1 DAK2 domain-containing protein [Acidimicrobiia bacterium]
MGLRSEDIKAVVRRYHERLTDYRDALNGLNVYPVPDGDTGTNMTLTMGSVVDSVDSAESMSDVADVISRSSMMGARGNSGVILSQILRGLADSFRHASEVGVDELAAALDSASIAAYRAVQRPVEGTILTVLREAAEAAKSGGGTAGQDLSMLLRSVYDRAVVALENTPEMLPVLKQAGVVDAGGAGFLLLLASFLEVVTGADVELPERVLRARADLDAIEVGQNNGIADLRYEVMFLLDCDEEGVERFRGEWEALGDSIVVVGGDGTWNCHIHTDHIGASIEAGIAVGRPRDIRITDLAEQAGEHSMHGAFEPMESSLDAEVGIVSVAVGSGLVEVFRQLGAQGVVSGGQSSNPSTEDLLRVVDAIPAKKVIVLPNNKNIVPVAEQLDALSTKTVAVVPTRSVPQGVAAMVGYDPGGEDILSVMEDMAAAASSVVTGEVTQAVRDAVVEFGRISAGDWLGIADGTIVVADTDIETALRGLVASIYMMGAELITIYEGEGSSQATVKALEAWLGELHPDLEMSVIFGGQPLYPYLISIE